MPYRAVLTDAAGEGREALVRLWTENLPVRGDPEAKLRWTYLEGPNGPGQVFVLRADDDRAVGCAGIQLRELASRGTIVRVALLGDFAIDRAHRTGLPALTLQRAVKRHVEAHYAASYGFPNDQALAIHKRTGYHELGRMNRYVRVLRHASFIARRYGRPLAARVAGAMLDPAIMTRTVARALRFGPTLELRWLDEFDARFDQLWDEANHGYPITARRSAALLRWRFLRKPDQEFSIAALVDRRTDALRAYAIVHEDPGGGAELADLFGANLEAVDALLALLIRGLYGRGFTTVLFRYLGDPRMRELLAKHRFSLRQAERAVVVHPTASWPIGVDARNGDAWYLTELDEDT
jgi:hypothetical protein